MLYARNTPKMKLMLPSNYTKCHLSMDHFAHSCALKACFFAVFSAEVILPDFNHYHVVVHSYVFPLFLSIYLGHQIQSYIINLLIFCSTDKFIKTAFLSFSYQFGPTSHIATAGTSITQIHVQNIGAYIF